MLEIERLLWDVWDLRKFDGKGNIISETWKDGLEWDRKKSKRAFQKTERKEQRQGRGRSQHMLREQWLSTVWWGGKWSQRSAEWLWNVMLRKIRAILGSAVNDEPLGRKDVTRSPCWHSEQVSHWEASSSSSLSLQLHIYITKAGEGESGGSLSSVQPRSLSGNTRLPCFLREI